MINIFHIIIIGLIYILIINPLEKLFVQLYYKTINRPNIKIENDNFNSLGMPSGHAETIVIIMMLLYFNNYINLNVAIFMIIFVCLQRILSHMHSLNQVLIGCLIGLIMSLIYNKLNLFIYCLIFSFIYISNLIIFLFIKIDNQIKKIPTPHWVDKSLYDIIEHKKKTTNINKIIYLLLFYFKITNNSVLFLTWMNLEKKLDIIIEKIKDKKIDAVIGIKTGGAILAKYISIKLNIPYDFIKISFDTKKCVKTPNEEIYFHITKNIKHFDDFICEDIKIDIKNKNILLLDELIATGKTIKYISKYLKEEKMAKNITVASISSYLEDNNNIRATDNIYIFWPWGYDN